MAITQFELDSLGPAGTSTTLVSNSKTPTAGRLQLVHVEGHRSGGAGEVQPSVSGCSLTWILVNGNTQWAGSTAWGNWLFMGVGLPTTGSITVTWSVNQDVRGLEWSEFDSDDGQQATVLQSAVHTDTSSPATVTLATFLQTGSGTYGCFATNNAITAGSGFTKIREITPSGGIPMSTEWKNTSDTTVDVTFSSGSAFGIACEIGVYSLEWVPQTSEWIRQPPLPIIEGLTLSGSADDPVVVADTSSEWMPPLEAPTIIPQPVMVGEFQLVDLGGSLAEDTFTLTPEWWRPSEEPVRQPLYPVAEGHFILNDRQDLQEDTLLEWHPLQNEPVRIPPSPVQVGDFQLLDLQSLQEDTFLEWWLNSNEPVRQPLRVVDEGWFSLTDLQSLQEDTFLEWLQQLSEPVWQPPRGVDIGEFQLANIEGLAEDTFLEWWLNANEPVKYPGRVVDEGLFTIDFSQLAAQEDTFLEWLPQLSEPTRLPPFLEGFETPDLTVALTISDFDFSWWVEMNIPVRLLPTPLQEGGLYILDANQLYDIIHFFKDFPDAVGAISRRPPDGYARLQSL